MGLRPLACWDFRFDSRRGHGCLSLVSVVFCKIEVSVAGRSFVQRSPTVCVSLRVIRCKKNLYTCNDLVEEVKTRKGRKEERRKVIVNSNYAPLCGRLQAHLAIHMFLFKCVNQRRSKFLSLYSVCDRWMKTEDALLVEWYWQGKNGSTWRRSCPSGILSTTNPARNDLELQAGICGKRLAATNRLSQHGTAFTFSSTLQGSEVTLYVSLYL